MEREDVLKFTNSVILLSKLFTTVEDKFLKRKLYEKLSDFVSAFMEQKSASSSASHNIDLNLKNSTNNLLDNLEYLAHISKNNVTPLLIAQRNLLKFKLHHILKQNEEGKTDKTSNTQQSLERLVSEHPATETELVLSKQKPTLLAQRRNNFGTGITTKERIFNYIKKTPDVRTKDVLNEFSALSGRTVKRSLKELIDGGFLRKRSDGIAVYYTCG